MSLMLLIVSAVMAQKQWTLTNGVVNTKVDKSYYNGSYSVNAQWTVWNGGRNWNTVKLDKLSEQQAELSRHE